MTAARLPLWLIRPSWHNIALLPAALFMTAIVTALPAFADESTMGGAIGHFAGNVNGPGWKLLMALCLVSGLACIYKGLKLIIMVGDGPSHHVISYAPPAAMLVVGALLAAFPDTVNSGIGSLFGAYTGYHGATFGSFGEPSDCLDTSSALTCVAKNVKENLVPVFIQASGVIGCLLGGFYLYTTLMGVAHEVGAGRPMSRGVATKVIVSIMMINIPLLMLFSARTLGLSDSVMGENGFNGGSDMLSYTGSSNISVVQSYSELITYIFAILAMFGVAAFWKGLFLLKDVADERARTGIGTAFTHMIGGICLANMKWLGGIATLTFLGKNLFR